MRSPEDLRLVRIVVPCAQTRLPGPGALEMHSRARASGASAAHSDSPCLAGHRASSEARGDVCSLSWSGGRFDVRAE